MDRGAGRLGRRRVRVERLTSRGGHVCGLGGWGQHGAWSARPCQPLLPPALHPARLPWACRASSPRSAPGALPTAPVPERRPVWAQTARPGPSSGSPEPSQGTPSPVSGRETWAPCPEAQRGRELGGCQPWGVHGEECLAPLLRLGFLTGKMGNNSAPTLKVPRR